MFKINSPLADEQKTEIRILKEEGLKPREISERLSIQLSRVYYNYSPYRRERALQNAKRRSQIPEIRKRISDYKKRPDVKEKQKEYRRIHLKKHPETRKKDIERSRKFLYEHVKPPNENFETVIDVFPDLNTRLNQIQIWEKIGGSYASINRRLKPFYEFGVLNKERVGRYVLYSLNPESPFLCFADGFFKEKERNCMKSLVYMERLPSSKKI